LIDQFVEPEARPLVPKRQEEATPTGAKFIYLQNLSGETKCEVLPEKPAVFDLVLLIDKDGHLARRETKIGGDKFGFDLQRLDLKTDEQDRVRQAVIKNTLFLDEPLTMEKGIAYPKELPTSSRFCGVVQEATYDQSGELVSSRLIVYPRKEDLGKFKQEQEEESAAQKASLRPGEEQILFWPEVIESLEKFRQQQEERISRGEIKTEPVPQRIDLPLLIKTAQEEEATPFLDLERFARSE